jgi:hypothetical protein
MTECCIERDWRGLTWLEVLVSDPDSTPVGNATLVVANVLTCNKISQYVVLPRIPLHNQHQQTASDYRHLPATVWGAGGWRLSRCTLSVTIWLCRAKQ